MAIKSAAAIFFIGICLAWVFRLIGPGVFFCGSAKEVKESLKCKAKTDTYPYISSCCVVIIAALSFKYAPV